MKVYFLITGLLRTFIKSLYPFLVLLSKYIDCKIIICTTDEKNDKYIGINVRDQFNEIMKKTNYTIIYISNNILQEEYTQRENNTIYQWYHIQTAFNHIKLLGIHDDDIVIRIRPDIHIHSSIEEFIKIIYKATETEGVCIPLGNDLFSESFRPYVMNSINDQIALGKYKYMKEYCNLFSETDFSRETPIISEKILYIYLQLKNIYVVRIPLEYSIYLSQCKLIAITGDSGVGKSTIVKALNKIFPYDSNLILETDRYHKWERNNEQWKTVTHLHPDANYLEYITDDTYRLKIGEDINQVDYDHATGKFTKPQPINPKPFIFLCGLHTLYRDELRSFLDIKIFIDVDTNLKKYWKIRRDVVERGYSIKDVNTIFNKRLEDYKEYILPQKEYADIIIRYYTNETIPEYTETNINIPEVECDIICNNNYIEYVKSFLENTSKDFIFHSDTYIYKLKSNLNVSQIMEHIPVLYHKYMKPDSLEVSHLGIIQCMLILILLKPTV